MGRNISDIPKNCYKKLRIGDNNIYTDQYGKIVIEDGSFATVVYNHDSNIADIYCNKCGEWIGDANCLTSSFWNYVHDVENAHKCSM